MFQRIELVFFVISLFVVCTLSNPMYYKKNVNDKYEPDLVAYSSTVIPLTSFEVSYGIGSKINEAEYMKAAYLKHLHKKVQHEDEDPDTLITLKKKIRMKQASEKEDKLAKIEIV